MRFSPAALPAVRRVTALLLIWATLAMAAPMGLAGQTAWHLGATTSTDTEAASLGSTGRDDHASRPWSAAVLRIGARSTGDGAHLQPVGEAPDGSRVTPQFVRVSTAAPRTILAPSSRFEAAQGRAPPVAARA